MLYFQNISIFKSISAIDFKSIPSVFRANYWDFQCLKKKKFNVYFVCFNWVTEPKFVISFIEIRILFRG